jgi:hypothetical protein
VEEEKVEVKAEELLLQLLQLLTTRRTGEKRGENVGE